MIFEGMCYWNKAMPWLRQLGCGWLLTMEHRVQSWMTSREISGGQSDTTGGSSPSLSRFCC
jgi:hypothetical protein